MERTPYAHAKVEMLPTDNIAEDPGQPRRPAPSGEALEGLKASVRTAGILSPLIVRKAPPELPQGFLLVAGSRRLRAARALKLAQVPAVVLALSDQEAREIQLIENLQREDLTPLEEAAGYQALADLGLTYNAIAERVGRSKGHVGNLIRLLKLPKVLQEAIAAGKLTAHHGRILAVLVPYPVLLEAVAKLVIRQRPDVSYLEESLDFFIQRSGGPARPLTTWAHWGPKNPLGQHGALFAPGNAVAVKSLIPLLQTRATAEGVFFNPLPCTKCPHGFGIKHGEGICVEPTGVCYEIRQLHAARLRAKEAREQRTAQGKAKSAAARERIRLERRRVRWEKLVVKAAAWIRRHRPRPAVLYLRELVEDFQDNYQMRPETIRALVGPELERAKVKVEQFKADPAKVLGKLPERRLAEILRLWQGMEDDAPTWSRRRRQARAPFALPVKGIGQHWRWR